MTKRQFMEELRSSLEGMVSQAVIQENMNYYEDYINEQIRNGKNEQDVLNELGSPRLIARSIIFIFIIYLLFHVFSAMMVVLGPVIIISVIVALIMKITGR